jgi:tetratricopeptide (TPR) repeat protein
MSKARAVVSISALLLLGSSSSLWPQPAVQTGPPPLLEGLGNFSRTVKTSSPDAQKYFNQGLALMYAFNHDEAIRSFRRAAELDPKCALAFWGIAVASGPHINNTVVPPERAKEAWEAVGKARALADTAGSADRALIAAAALRYADPPPQDRAPLDRAYADAMRKVWKAFPKDADVGALFAEALADLRPWDLWTAEGQPQPGTEELVATLDAVLALEPRHPLANHLMIHAVEASPHPEKADRAAETLRDLQPGLGHLVHMPSHIDVRRGRWEASIAANTRAIEADRKYVARSREQGFYRLYMAHNHHMLAYSAMMTGQSALALRTIREMVGDMPPSFFKENIWADGLMAMPLEVLMRFGKWDDILAQPAFPAYVPLSRSLQNYARAISYAAKGNADAAAKEQAAFMEERKKVVKEATLGNNTGADILDLAESFMRGELLFRSGKIDEGIAALREAAAREDRLRYDEPPDWIQPVRHALGAALLSAGRFADAEAVFREDLQKLPENGWSLYGLSRALSLQKKDAEALRVEKQFDAVWKKADVKIKSACLCIPGV